MDIRLRELTERPAVLAMIFFIYSLLAVPSIALLMPPFQAADELAHLERADQVSRGSMIAVHIADGSTGGRVDRAIPLAGAPFDGIRFHPEIKVTRPMLKAANAIQWAHTGLGDVAFPNTAIYPPLLYLPAAVALDVGRLVRLSVMHTLELVRLLAGLTSIVVSAVAIAKSREAALFLFTVLCLPMSLALFASASQDGPMIALAAVVFAALQTTRERGRSVAIACVALALILMARPPYLPLAFIF